jgi:hypothetical protein
LSKFQQREAIVRIADTLSAKFKDCLCKGRLRHGIAQKAFSLYLKYLWRLRIVVVPPPLCPVDRVVLRAAGIYGSWTKCDSEEQYVEWINKLSEKADPVCLAEWENQVWLEWLLAQKQRAANAPRCCAERAVAPESANRANCA